MKLLFTILALTLFLNCNSDKTKLTPQQQNQLQTSIKEGKLIYDDFCVTCHLDNGKGVAKVFPPLDNSDYLKEKQTASIKAIKHGLHGEITVNGDVYNGAMTSLGLSDKEIADVMNYINNSWSNTIKGIVTEDRVSKL